MVTIADFEKAYENRHSLAWQWKKEGKKIFGYLYSSTPEELIYAAGIIPVQLTESEDLEAFRKGKVDIPEFFCNFSISCAGQGVDGVYSYLDGLIIPDSCPQGRTIFEVWQERCKPPFFYYFYVPNEKHEDSIKFYIEELKNVKTRIEKFVGKKISDADLRQAIEVYNENRTLMKRLYELRERDNPPISGSQVFEVFKAGLIMPKEEHNKMLKELLEEIPKWEGRKVEDRPRVMAFSYIFEECNGKMYPNFIQMIEKLGGEVVSDELCQGSRYYWGEVELETNLFEALADRYIEGVPHAYKARHTYRIGNILESIKKYRVKGVVFFLPKYCMTYWFQQYLIDKAMEKKGIPYITIETLAGMPEAPVRTRIEAFIEMLNAG